MNDLLAIENFSFAFVRKKSVLHVLHDVNLNIASGERVGLVGESGSGKSTLARAILRLHDFKHHLQTPGSIRFEGKELLEMGEEKLNSIRGSKISIVFQDPLSSLNPMFKLRNQIAEVLIHRRDISRSDIDDLIRESFYDLHLTPPERYMNAYPFQLSGGQRQRVLIAMALISNPKLLIADEITSSLDAIIAGEILELLDKLCRKHGSSILMISHNLHTVKNFVDRIAILYGGHLLEVLPSVHLPEQASHPYTRALFFCADAKRDEEGKFKSIDGFPPSPDALIKGCPFLTRCEHQTDLCRDELPVFKQLKYGGVRCHHSEILREAT